MNSAKSCQLGNALGQRMLVGGAIATAGVGLTLEAGNLACPFSANACSEARAHTIAASAGASITDPCGSEVGGFSVSSLAHLTGGRCCDGNVCDLASSYYAAGVRSQH